MILTSSGNLGIGVSNPTNKLETNDSISIAYDTNTNSYFGRSAIGYGVYNDCAWFSHVDKVSTGNYALLQNANGQTIINSSTSQGLYFRENNNNKMILLEGNLGIGTVIPKSKLDIYGGVTIGSSYSGINSSPSNGMIIEGSVGIGTVDPKSKFDINGSISSTSS